MADNLPTNAKLLQIIINGGLVTVTLLTLYGSYLLVSDHMSQQTEALIGIKEAVIEIKAAVQASTEQSKRVEAALLRY